MELIIHSANFPSRVIITKDFPELYIKKGDMGTLIELDKNNESKDDYAIVEIINFMDNQKQKVKLPVSFLKFIDEN